MHRQFVRFFLHEHHLYIGTKIHLAYGGIWELHLESGEMRHIKHERDQMVAAMTISNSYFVAESGACRGKTGNISFCHIDDMYEQTTIHWQTCNGAERENSYLDLSVDGEIIYTTSTQNEVGISTVSRIFLEEGTMTTCGSIQGHGWRIINEKDAYIVAGSTQSMSSSLFI
jgi:hypothetical protein